MLLLQPKTDNETRNDLHNCFSSRYSSCKAPFEMRFLFNYGLFHPNQLNEPMSNFRGVWCTFSFLFYFEWIFLVATNEDSDQTPRSDLGLHCLPMSQKWDARLIWVKIGVL